MESPLDQSNKVSKTQKIYHKKPVEPVGLDYHILFEKPKVLKPKYHERFGVSNVELFVDEMMKLEKKNQFFFNTDILLNMTDEVDEKFMKATECWFCNQPFTPLSLGINGNGKV